MDCWQASPIAPASPSRTSGNALAEPPLPDISGHPRRRGPVSGVPSYRSSSGELCHNSHKPFFLYPLKPNNPGLRVSKYPLNICSRTISWKPIFVQQSSLFSHPVIIHISLSTLNYLFLLFHATLGATKCSYLPTRFHDEPFF